MSLVGRGSLQEKANGDIEQISSCNENACHCLEDLKDKLKYSILSHRWSSHELTFDELQKFDTLLAARNESDLTGSTRTEKIQEHYRDTPYEDSVAKLVEFLRASAKKQCEYAWADTLCINKESSAELDESILSMYAWYQDSHICIVHLSRTTFPADIEMDPWFTRGWTLQELLAPKRIVFFSQDWDYITTTDGDKIQEKQRLETEQKRDGEGSLWPKISDITGIPIEDLLDFKPGLYDIGKRLSWASKRRTTRIEDMAYCLIGIFHVNLSISYGEKEGAFYRLQAEILQNTSDRTLFNWKGHPSPYNSMFAISPKAFSSERQDVDDSSMSLAVNMDPASSSANFELRMSLVLYHKSEPATKNWNVNPKATAFVILGPSIKPNEHFIVALERVGITRQYKRLNIWSTEIDAELLEKVPEEIIFK